MPEKVSRIDGAVTSAFIAGATVAKAPFWAIYQGIPLGIASVFSKRARSSLAYSFKEHIGHPLLHDVPAGLSGQALNFWEDWDGWSRLRDILWPKNDPRRPSDPSPDNKSGSPRPQLAWPKPPDLYGALEVMPTATADQIQAAYRRLVRIWHPDVCKRPDAMDKFVLVDKAYKVLRDPDLRRKYDALVASTARA